MSVGIRCCPVWRHQCQAVSAVNQTDENTTWKVKGKIPVWMKAHFRSLRHRGKMSTRWDARDIAPVLTTANPSTPLLLANFVFNWHRALCLWTILQVVFFGEFCDSSKTHCSSGTSSRKSSVDSDNTIASSNRSTGCFSCFGSLSSLLHVSTPSRESISCSTSQVSVLPDPTSVGLGSKSWLGRVPHWNVFKSIVDWFVGASLCDELSPVTPVSLGVVFTVRFNRLHSGHGSHSFLLWGCWEGPSCRNTRSEWSNWLQAYEKISKFQKLFRQSKNPHNKTRNEARQCQLPTTKSCSGMQKDQSSSPLVPLIMAPLWGHQRKQTGDCEGCCQTTTCCTK